jgi:hypothetical protein
MPQPTTTSATAASSNTPRVELTTGFEPVALLAAAVLPGAGHAARGEIRRGLHIAAGILGLYASGILIGGISVIDRKENDWWFVGQAMVGPVTFGLDYLHQTRLKEMTSSGVRLTPDPAVSKYTRAVGKPLDVGILFTAIAGMLNVIAVIDAGFPTRRRTHTPNA